VIDFPMITRTDLRRLIAQVCHVDTRTAGFWLEKAVEHRIILQVIKPKRRKKGSRGKEPDRFIVRKYS